MGNLWSRAASTTEEAPVAAIADPLLEVEMAEQYPAGFHVKIGKQTLRPCVKQRLPSRENYWDHLVRRINPLLAQHGRLDLFVPFAPHSLSTHISWVNQGPIEMYWMRRCRFLTEDGLHETLPGLLVLQRVPRLDELYYYTEPTAAPPTTAASNWWPPRIFGFAVSTPTPADLDLEGALLRPIPYRAYIFTATGGYPVLERVILEEWTRPA